MPQPEKNVNKDQGVGSDIHTDIHQLALLTQLAKSGNKFAQYDLICLFVDLLGPGKPNTFQTFSEGQESQSPKPRILHGQIKELWHELRDLNESGHGIFVAVNETDGEGRTNQNIVRVRTLFVDLDGAPLAPVDECKLQPHCVNETSPGRYHAYWLVADCPLDQFKALQKALADRFNADPAVCDLARVMRVPGFLHQKREPFLSRIVSINPDLPPYPLQDLVDGLDLKDNEAPRGDGVQCEFTSAEILAALRENEDGDSSLFKRTNQGRFCFDHAAGEWFKWQGHHWSEDLIGERFDAIGEVIDLYILEAERRARIAVDAARQEDKDQSKFHEKKRRELLTRVSQLQTKPRKDRILFLAAQGLDGLGIRGDDWDQDPWLLGCENGVIDLRDGSFRDGQPGHFIKTVCPTSFKGCDDPCPEWDQFIKRIIVDEALKEDEPTAKYLQRLLGYGITGLRQEHIIAVFWGKAGRNGKGTLFETLAHVLGPVARKLPSEILLQSARPRDSAGPRPDLMDLRGRRLCWANETNEGRKLDLSLAKELGGGDTISARQLQGKMTNFVPTHTIILSTNYRPKVESSPNDPIWDRLQMVPFRLKFVDDPKELHERQRDKNLLERLKNEASGILGWLVRGAMEWHEQGGLNPPANVKIATDSYRKGEDVVGQFIDESCEVSHDKVCQAGPLYDAYKEWAVNGGHNILNQRRFGDNMTERFDKYKRDGRHVFYIGIGLPHGGDGRLTTMQ